MSKDTLPRTRPNWHEKLDQVSEKIRLAEEGMIARGCCAPASSGELLWVKHGKSFRIVKVDRPLIEFPTPDRVEALPQIEALMDAADAAMSELFK